MQPAFDAAWADDLPPMVVATLDAERSFYLDYQDGSQLWETYILEEWLPSLRQAFPVGDT